MAIWDQCVTKAAACRYLLTTNPGHSDDLHVKHPETLWLGSNFAPFAPPRTLRAHPGLSALPPPAPCASCKGIASPPVNVQNTMAPLRAGNAAGATAATHHGPGPLPTALGNPPGCFSKAESPERREERGALRSWQGRPAADIARPLPGKQGHTGGGVGPATPRSEAPEAPPRGWRPARCRRGQRGGGDEGTAGVGGREGAPPTAVTSRPARGTFR